MKPLTSDQKEKLESMQKLPPFSLEADIKIIQAGLDLALAKGNHHNIAFYQGLLHYLTWPRKG